MSLTVSLEDEKRYGELQAIALDFAREGNSIELEKMISYGMNVNLCTHKEDTLLMLATYNGNLETSKMLIAKGADVERRNQRGQTPLEGVCFKGNMAIVKLLVENGALIDKNATIYASMFGHKEIVAYLKAQNNSTKDIKILGISAKFIASLTSVFRNFFTRDAQLA